MWNVEHFGARAGDTAPRVQRVVDFEKAVSLVDAMLGAGLAEKM